MEIDMACKGNMATLKDVKAEIYAIQRVTTHWCFPIFIEQWSQF